MKKDREFTLDTKLREIQILLGKPGKKILGTLSYYLNFLIPFGRSIKEGKLFTKRSNIKTQKHNNITWIDIKNPTRAEINDLAQKYPFHPLHLELTLTKGQLSQIEVEPDYVFLLLLIPNYDNQENKVVTEQTCIFLGKNYLVTIHEESAHEARDLFDLCQREKGLRDAYFEKSAGYLLYNVIDSLLKDVSALSQRVLLELDEIEDIVFDVKVSGIYQIGELRQKIVKLRRVLTSLRKVLDQLTNKANDFVGGSLFRYFDNINNLMDRLWEIVEEARETIEIYKDADFTVHTERTNKILALLTIVFTLTIPATVIGTFYGMNILLPGGLEAGSWTFWGPYTTLIIIIGITSIPLTLMLFLFKRKRWV